MKALVLSGGGARGSFQVGMLKHLIGEMGLDFEVIRGISVGALNSSFLAQAPAGNENLKVRVDELETLWRHEIKGNDSVYGSRIGGKLGLALGADSIFTLKPLMGLIAKYVSLARLKASGRDFKVGTVSLVSGDYREWGPEDDPFPELLRASAAIPVVFPFVHLEGREDVLVDGGVRNITPLSSAFRSGATEIYVLLASFIDGAAPSDWSGVIRQEYGDWRDNRIGTKVGGFHVLMRTVDILSDEVYLDDIRNALHWNRVVRAYDALAAEMAGSEDKAGGALEALRETVKRRSVRMHIIAPRLKHGPENSSTDFDPDLIAASIDHGMEVAADRSQWLYSDGPEA